MKHRLFVAITLPDSVTGEIVSLQNRLSFLGPTVTWLPPEKLHLTLNFLGRVEDKDVPAVSRVVSESVAVTRAFSLIPMFLETMYRRHESSFIYLGLGGEIDPLKDFQSILADAFTSIKFPQPDRFLPHIVIGNLARTDPVTTKSTLSEVGQTDFSPLSPFTVGKLILFESFLSKAGSHYQPVRHFVIQ